MIHNVKTLGLALAAFFAMSAMVASAASAQGKLTASEPMTLTATETGAVNANQFTMFGASIRCPGSHYTGHKVITHAETTHNISTGKPKHNELIPSGATQATLTPEFTQTTQFGVPNCAVAGLGWSFTIHMNECDFVATLGATTGGGATYGVTFDVICPPGQEITLTMWTTEALHTSQPNTPFCVIHIPGSPANQNLPGAHVTNTAGGHIDIQGKVTGITATKTASASHPVLCAEATTNTATFDIDVTVQAHNAEKDPLPISLSD